MVVGIGLERGVQLVELGVVDTVLAADLAGRTERDDAALRGTEAQCGYRGRHRLVGAVEGGSLTKTTVSAAPGAIEWTTSASKTSSP